MSRDRPALRMIVGNGGSLRPADAYSESAMMRYQPGRELEVRPMPDLTYWKKRRYWQILDLILERCEVRWKTKDEMHDVLKLACGVVVLSVSPQGHEVVMPGTTTTMEDAEFDDYYENAMVWLWETTKVDPETLEREVGKLPEGAQQTLPGEEGDGGSLEPPPRTTTVADPDESPAMHLTGDEEGGSGKRVDASAAAADPTIVMRHENINDRPDGRAMVNTVDPMSTAALKQEAIKKILDLYLDETINEGDLNENVAKAHKWWTEKMPGHPNFVKTVFETAAKVARKELPRPAAANYLFGLRDG